MLPNGIQLSDPGAPRISGKESTPTRKRRPNTELRDAMREAGMSPNDLAREAGLGSGQTVRNALEGRVPLPRNQKAMATALDRRPKDLFKRPRTRKTPS